jgi:uncharacterized membrane protein
LTPVFLVYPHTALYFSAGMLILGELSDGSYRGAFTIFLATINFVFAFTLYKNDKVDRNLLFLLIGLVLTFVSLAAPIQLEGNYITLFWALESVLLVWLAYKSGISFLRDASVLLVALLIISLIMDWNNIYFAYINPGTKSSLTPIINKGFITSLIAIGGLIGYSMLMKKYFSGETILKFEISRYVPILHIVILLFIYSALYLELNYQATVHFPVTRVLVLGCYNYICAIVLLCLVRSKSLETKFVVMVFAIALIVFFSILFNKETIQIRDSYLLSSGATMGSFVVHYALVALLLTTLYWIYNTSRSFADELKLKEVFQIFFIATMVYVASAELDHIVVLGRYTATKPIDTILQTNHKAGFAILWGICSFVLIYLGMRWKSKTIRIASLALFAFTLLKLFIFDIRGLSEGGRIAAFISLGVILLIVSFMYQKLKTIILADELKAADDEKI